VRRPRKPKPKPRPQKIAERKRQEAIRKLERQQSWERSRPDKPPLVAFGDIFGNTFNKAGWNALFSVKGAMQAASQRQELWPDFQELWPMIEGAYLSEDVPVHEILAELCIDPIAARSGVKALLAAAKQAIKSKRFREAILRDVAGIRGWILDRL